MKTEHKVLKNLKKKKGRPTGLMNKSHHIERKKRWQKGRWCVHSGEKAPNTVFRLKKKELCQITMKWVQGWQQKWALSLT